jgi:hypothetical protein
MRQIQKIILGISPPAGTVKPPSWTNRVNSHCYMIGPHTSPYYSQVWYDWDRGVHVTLIVHRCRAVINDDPCFGTLSIWRVASSDERGDWQANFWYRFTDQQKQVIFSMGPPHFLTLIDYQTFVQNGAIEACIFDNPCDQLPACPRPKIVMAQTLPPFTRPA